ncbi:hypothetical protein RDV89_10165 [Nocardioides zeae]|uniref:DUF4185 domain-containing protein n=1 Tax=Nocardioides imazamoxiresistens TaxID=3231893 RepID=A0ABU3PW30_9ACTN|nr:hypothetical protein [Nocardioides zeae]MDT9593432.1 hypothetical protein [Nocardioides zeae]
MRDDGERQGPATRVRLALLALLCAAVAWVVAAGVVTDDGPRDAPVVLVGPDVVTAAVAAEVEALPGDAFVVGGTDDPQRARDMLAAGEVVGALVVDLAGTEDTLLLAPDHAPVRDRAVVERVRAVETARDRTVAVERTGDALRGAPPAATTFAAAVVGLLVVVVVSMVWGPVARTLRRGLTRTAGLAVAGVLTGLVAAAVAAWPAGDVDPGVGAGVRIGAVTAGTVLVAGLVALACEALAGLRGLLVAAVLLLAVPLPLVLAGDTWLLAEPWRTVAGWSVVGAAADAHAALTAHSGGPGWRAAVVLLGTPALAVGVLLASRAVAARTPGDGPDPDAGPRALPTPVSWRRQMAVLATTLVLATTAVLTVGLPGAPTPTPPRVSLAATSDCVDAGPVGSVDDLNRVAELRGDAAFQGGDVGASARLQDGRTVWMFGDTLRAADFPGDRFVRNSMLLVDPSCLRVVVPRSGGAVVPDRDEEVGYWPMSVAVQEQPGYDLVEVTAQRVRTVDEGDPFGFENVGPAVATFVVPVGGVPQLVEVTDLGPDEPDPTVPMWGAATAVVDGWLHLYGTARPVDPAPGTGFSLRVARVRPADVADQRAWTYWDGSGWSPESSAAVELIGAAEGTSQTLSVFERDGTWYAVSKRGEVLGSDLVVWTAPAPGGPFTAQPPVAALPSDVADGLLRYMPLAHPDLLPSDGSVVVSYSRNSTDVDAVLDDPLLYRPRFLTVPLPQPQG